MTFKIGRISGPIVYQEKMEIYFMSLLLIILVVVLLLGGGGYYGRGRWY